MSFMDGKIDDTGDSVAVVMNHLSNDCKDDSSAENFVFAVSELVERTLSAREAAGQVQEKITTLEKKQLEQRRWIQHAERESKTVFQSLNNKVELASLGAREHYLKLKTEAEQSKANLTKIDNDVQKTREDFVRALSINAKLRRVIEKETARNANLKQVHETQLKMQEQTKQDLKHIEAIRRDLTLQIQMIGEMDHSTRGFCRELQGLVLQGENAAKVQSNVLYALRVKRNRERMQKRSREIETSSGDIVKESLLEIQKRSFSDEEKALEQIETEIARIRSQSKEKQSNVFLMKEQIKKLNSYDEKKSIDMTESATQTIFSSKTHKY